MSKEVTVREVGVKNFDLDKAADMQAMSKVLKLHIVKHQLFTKIQGKNYAHVEGWQFAGGMLGLFPKVTAVENLSAGQEKKWKAAVEIVDREGKAVSSGFAICSDKESKRKNADEYVILSMAQTRATGKAFRNLIGWVMKLAQFEGTPSEEMQGVGQAPKAAEADAASEGDAPRHVCSVCDAPVSEQVANYSKSRFNKILCREHQPQPKKK